MPRRLSVSNLYSQKFKFMPFTGEWKKILGNRERKGCWMIYGNAKNGKTSFALRLANYLSSIEKVLYIAAEEGCDEFILLFRHFFRLSRHLLPPFS